MSRQPSRPAPPTARGRPPLPPGRRADDLLIVRMTSEARARLGREAMRQGLTASEFVRQAVRKAIAEGQVVEVDGAGTVHLKGGEPC